MVVQLQKYFEEFHETIKLNYDDNSYLRETRDEIIEVLKKELKEQVSVNFTTFNQGSYAMFTGIKAMDLGDYDIDVGVIFEIDKEEYTNPIEVKEWIYNALKNSYEDVEMKRPCVTVKFPSTRKEERNIHVDFAVYSQKNQNSYNYIAKGKLNSSVENRVWEICEPKELLDKIKNNLEDTNERRQFRRIIRYMKRWKDNKFKNQVNRPTGIGLTVAGLNYFNPNYTKDIFKNEKKFNDFEALENFVNNMINAFKSVYEDGVFGSRLHIYLPTQPYNDIYEGMSLKQMEDFKEKLINLLNIIIEVKDEIDPKVACEKLSKEFGDDFPIPEDSETAERKNIAILNNTSSAFDYEF
ncbi:nucleotidyltransferase domain-containing protein [Lysinibacillus fusiformis]|uniref:nucleotidyltransferase domain-containing protein n=1 Tax=Lysinibacillus fusiformis TaxID=28031 RepID=UPI0023A94D8A|nr:nucleotidyltransferase [Lysinibacillus fusiformis]WEA41643.1 nucleotidyltransferase [Lysinibacillus fusiformis]